VADWRDEADRWWSGVLRLPPGALRGGGVFPADHLDHVGVFWVAGAPGPVVYGPGEVLPTVAAVTARAAGGVAELGSALAAGLGPQAGPLMGPAWYGYVSADLLTAEQSSPGRKHTLRRGAAGAGMVRALGAADLPLLARLHEQATPGEVAESGTDGLPAFGYIEAGALLAVACLGSWHVMPTIGVLTHPGARRRGLAARVVAAAAQAGLGRRAVVQYRAFSANTASISVARRCGFAHYGDALIIDVAR
jgi:GNAT superfamily N-acetyltransferase